MCILARGGGCNVFVAGNITKLKNCITFTCTGCVSEHTRLNFRMNSQSSGPFVVILFCASERQPVFLIVRRKTV